jgi:hypothetical protein
MPLSRSDFSKAYRTLLDIRAETNVTEAEVDDQYESYRAIVDLLGEDGLLAVAQDESGTNRIIVRKCR